MKILVFIILLIASPVLAFLPMLGKPGVSGGGATVWRENTASQTSTLGFSSTNARGQRIDITSNFTLNKIILQIADVTGELTIECRVGTSVDLSSYDERWTGVSPQNGDNTLTSSSNPSYTTANAKFYFACIRDSGAGTANLSYSGNEWTDLNDKQMYAPSAGWNITYAVESYDLRMAIWKN